MLRKALLVTALCLVTAPAWSQQILSGNSNGAAPVASVGAEGQFFLDNSTGTIYGPKSNGKWPAAVSTIASQLAAGPGFTSGGPIGVAASVPTITSCGGGTPTMTAGSNANSGQFTLGTSTPTACTVTFAKAYSTISFCTVAPASSGGAAITGGWYISANDKTGFTLTLGTGTNSLIFNYTCGGN